MLRFRMFLCALLCTPFSFSAFVYAQPSWSNILSPSRAISWAGAGLPATLPDGETTINPWTPPTRAQCGSTLNPSGFTDGTDTTNINKALAACAPGHYVLLGAGTFNLEAAGNCFGGSVTCIQLYALNGVTLRGSGPQSTIIKLVGAAQIAFGISWNNGSCSWTSGYSAGTSTLTMKNCTGPALVAGELAALTQCDTGYSGSPCAGTSADNGGLYVCGGQIACDSDGTGPGISNRNQIQMVYVNSVTGNCNTLCTVRFSPGLYAPNWSSNNSPVVTWVTSSPAGNTVTPYGNGLEDLTVDATGATLNEGIFLINTYASWIKGVRVVGAAGGDAISTNSTKNCLLFNNYLYADELASGSNAVFNQMGATSDTLMLNNIVTGGQTWNGTGGNEGNVIAHNYGRDSQTGYYQLAMYDHESGDAFTLIEANQTGLFLADNTWGTQDLSTVFRNYLNGTDPPYGTATSARVIKIDNYARFENIIGNVLGGNSSLITTYQTNGALNSVYIISNNTDTLSGASLLRWGNWDNVTNAVRWCGNSSSPGWSTTCSSSSEVPTSLNSNAAPFINLVPSSTTLPCSFFLPGYTSTNCTPHSSGGTGLSWWKVCSVWSTFPTSCSAFQTQPFPPIGPDVSGGNNASGYAYDLPAAVAFKNLPIDTAYQNSYAITSSTWSGGTETLTVSGLPNGSTHILGPFQVSGGNCSTGTGEAYMTSSSAMSGTISYALASNPGSCSGGTMKFPDVRQFDERVYVADPAVQPAAPTGLTGIPR
jgi:hypothetical protein